MGQAQTATLGFATVSQGVPATTSCPWNLRTDPFPTSPSTPAHSCGLFAAHPCFSWIATSFLVRGGWISRDGRTQPAECWAPRATGARPARVVRSRPPALVTRACVLTCRGSDESEWSGQALGGRTSDLVRKRQRSARAAGPCRPPLCRSPSPIPGLRHHLSLLLSSSSSGVHFHL